MAAVKTLADGREKWTVLTTKPAAPTALKLADLTAGIDASCQIAKNGSRISATASDTVSDPALCSDTNAQAFGASNYEGSIAPFRLLDPVTGAYATADNTVMEAVALKGTTLWIAVREGPKATTAWAVGDDYELYEVLTDNPQRPSEAGTYIKRNVPLAVQQNWSGKVAS